MSSHRTGYPIGVPYLGTLSHAPPYPARSPYLTSTGRATITPS
jgi:hypothetical protein